MTNITMAIYDTAADIYPLRSVTVRSEGLGSKKIYRVTAEAPSLEDTISVGGKYSVEDALRMAIDHLYSCREQATAAVNAHLAVKEYSVALNSEFRLDPSDSIELWRSMCETEIARLRKESPGPMVGEDGRGVLMVLDAYRLGDTEDSRYNVVVYEEETDGELGVYTDPLDVFPHSVQDTLAAATSDAIDFVAGAADEEQLVRVEMDSYANGYRRGKAVVTRDDVHSGLWWVDAGEHRTPLSRLDGALRVAAHLTAGPEAVQHSITPGSMTSIAPRTRTTTLAEPIDPGTAHPDSTALTAAGIEL